MRQIISLKTERDGMEQNGMGWNGDGMEYVGDWGVLCCWLVHDIPGVLSLLGSYHLDLPRLTNSM